MARVTTQKTKTDRKCSMCGDLIPIGTEYRKTKPFRQTPRVACARCSNKASFAETNPKKRTVLEAQEAADDCISEAVVIEDLCAAVDSLCESAQDVKSEWEEQAENIPENFEEKRTEAEGAAEALESWIFDLESASCDIGEMQEEYDGIPEEKDGSDEDARTREDVVNDARDKAAEAVYALDM